MRHVLDHMLGLKRPYGSPEEGSMVPYLIKQLDAPTWVDGAGNLHCDMRQEYDHRTLFVGHLDTMHWKAGVNQYTTSEDGCVRAIKGKGEVLGADDAAGVAILCEMIKQRVPAYYIFTRGEEAGCMGSKWLASEAEDLLLEFDRAVAFDRKGTADVICWQMGAPCCSNEFAEALSDALNEQGLLYMPAKGIYTDTAEFVGIIPECTNISVGYYNEHTDREMLYLPHWYALRAAACEIDWDSLPVVGTWMDTVEDDVQSNPLAWISKELK